MDQAGGRLVLLVGRFVCLYCFWLCVWTVDVEFSVVGLCFLIARV